MGWTRRARERFAVPLPHGADPAVTAYDLGFVVERPARRLPRRRRRAGAAVRRPTGGRRDPAGTATGGPRRRARRWPTTRSRSPGSGSPRTRSWCRSAGCWPRSTRPGPPWTDAGACRAAASTPARSRAPTVVREVHEETAQDVELGALVAVQTSHWVGRSPGGQVEDFHAVRLVYRATCPEPGEPVVLDVGGTTADARWVPLDRWRSVPLDGQLAGGAGPAATGLSVTEPRQSRRRHAVSRARRAHERRLSVTRAVSRRRPAGPGGSAPRSACRRPAPAARRCRPAARRPCSPAPTRPASAAAPPSPTPPRPRAGRGG